MMVWLKRAEMVIMALAAWAFSKPPVAASSMLMPCRTSA